jgi:DNA-binding CsgD family transcriptional regulator
MDGGGRAAYICRMLLGRERECARLDALISRVRGGSSAVLVIEGEAGIGKTSLLEYAAAKARGLRILRARGTEPDQDLPFAGLADLLRPVLGRLDALPGPQRAVLAGALALGPAVPDGVFAFCAATLSLLAAEAGRQPVLALIDDAHWLDTASARAVGFTARRLSHDAIGLVVAVRRTPSGGPDAAHRWLDAVPGDTMVVPGLDDAAAARLLAASGRAIATPVARRLAQGTGGNPLALLELPAVLSKAQLSGLAVLPEPLPVSAALRHVFALRLAALDDCTRRMLLLAAAAVVDLGTLRRASGLLSLVPGDLSAAEDADLIRVRDGQVEFTHPLLRSACYYTAGPEERRAAHRALAAVSDQEREPIRRAWHLAAAAVGPDEDAADSLEQAAHVARGRNAFAAASRAYQRAAELTVDEDRRVSRLVEAGRAAHLSGDPESAVRLLRRALDLARDPLARADAEVLHAQAAVYTAPSLELVRELIGAADAVVPLDPARAAVLLASASDVCRLIGRVGLAAETAARAARLADGAAGIPWLLSHASLAKVTVLTGGRAAGRAIISRVLDHPDAKGSDPAVDLVKVRCGQALVWCEEHRWAEEVLRSTVESARALGRGADLRYALASLSDLHFRTDDWGQALAEATEAVELTTDLGIRSDPGWALVSLARVEAATGAEQASREHLARAIGLSRPRKVASVWAMAAAVSGFLELGIGDYARAVADLEQAGALVSAQGVKEPCLLTWRPDFIESLARLGRLAEARQQLATLEAEASATGSRWAAAATARCRGLLEDTPRRAVARLEEAVAVAEASTSRFDQARARLCLGETLRRVRQRDAAQRQLREAHVTFELLGAGPWAARAAALLASAGVSAAARSGPVHVRLTPQELRVALHVAEGLSNQEVAARLFVSHKTVEVHLGHIYDKLGVRSRTGLARLVHVGELE